MEPISHTSEDVDVHDLGNCEMSQLSFQTLEFVRTSLSAVSIDIILLINNLREFGVTAIILTPGACGRGSRGSAGSAACPKPLVLFSKLLLFTKSSMLSLITQTVSFIR